MADIKRKLMRNTAFNVLLRFSRYIIAILMLPFIVGHVGEYDYGLYLLVGAFVGYFGLLDFGMGTALVKYIAEHNAKKENEVLNRIFNSVFFFYAIIGVVICIAVMILGTYYTSLFGIEPSQIDKARAIAYLVAIGALTSWPLKSFATALQGLQRYDLYSMNELVIAVVNALAIVILLTNGYGIIDMMFWGIVIGSIGQLVPVFMTRHFLPFMSFKRSLIDMATIKRVFKFSSVVFLGQIGTLIILGTDKIVIGAFVSVGALVSYEVARLLHDVAYQSANLPTSALLPAATEINALGDKDKMERLTIRGGKYKCAIMLCVTTILIVMAEPVISVWMGPDYHDVTLVSQVFLSYWLLYAAWGVTTNILLSMEKIKPIIMITFVTAIGNLGLSIVLAPIYGIMGVVLGTVIPYLIILPIVIPYSFKLIDMKMSKYAKEVWLKTYPFAASTFIVLYFLNDILEPASIIMVGLMGFTGLALFGSQFYFLGMERYEKDQLWGYVRSFLPARS